jgi:hypothetical protein
MTNDWNGVVEYAKAHPTNHGLNWNGRCEAFVSDAGAYTNSFENATAARKASRVYLPSALAINAVPTGWLLWWDYNPDGHVGLPAAPGGLALMASGFVTQEIHSNLGYIKRSDYAVKSGHRYLGASPDHGGQFLVGIPHTPPAPKPNRIKTIAAFLNRQGYGRHTTADQDGKVDKSGDVYQNYTWLLQTWGRRHGHYPAPLLIDGKWGPRTQIVDDLLWKELS